MTHRLRINPNEMNCSFPMREDGKAVRIYLNGVEALPETSASVLYDYLNKLGSDGWEMINFTFYPNKTAFYYFKRPVK